MPIVQSAPLMTDDKYVVRKADGEILPPGTYFVIKSTDLFAYAGLWAYCQSLETVLELATDRPDALKPEEREKLRSIADHVSALASAWQKAGLGRVPD